MVRTATPAAAAINRRHLVLANGTGYWKSEFIASAPGAPPGPQAFLVEQDPDTVILPHFHQQDQFQVVVAGEGTLGRHAVRPVSVHYAGKHTGYGPITAGSQGLWYFSLRPVTDVGAQFLPEARPPREAPKRHLMGKTLEPSSARVERLAVAEALPPQPDGIGAWMLRIPPGATAEAPQHPGGARFHIVVSGELCLGEERLPRLSTVFSDEKNLPLTASDGGVEVLILQYPL